MKPIDLYLVLTAYTLTVTVAALAELLIYRKARLWLPAGVTVLALVLNTMAGVWVDAEHSYLQMIRGLIEARDVSSLAALLMGFAAGMIWFSRYLGPAESTDGSRRRWWEPLLLSTSVACFVGCGQAFLWKEILGITRHAVSVNSPDFVIEQIATLDDEPLRVTTDDAGDVYVCFDYFKKHGAWGGAVLRFQEDPTTGVFESKTIVESPILARCYGMVVKDGDLFISRSGFNPHTDKGQIRYDATGAITQLKDLDGDGYYEYADDVITGLPGVRAPDTMQQNNGLVFGPDGSLFVTNASAADRTLDEHPWGGTILRYGPDFSGPEIFAEGFRNPWTIMFGPNGDLFVTDSDVDKNPGDEINHVIQGEHYGHPFVIPNEKGVEAVGYREPILVAEQETVFLGLVYATSPSIPEPYRNCMYVTDFRRNRVLRFRLVPKGDTYEVTEVTHFASIPTPVDMTITPEGDFYIISRRASKMYRIRPKANLDN